MMVGILIAKYYLLSNFNFRICINILSILDTFTYVLYITIKQEGCNLRTCGQQEHCWLRWQCWCPKVGPMAKKTGTI